MMTRYFLHELTWPEAGRVLKKARMALLPTGTVEQHGPQNPLGSDFMVADYLARKAAERTGTLCLPVLAYGVSAHDRQFWGSVTLSYETFESCISEICNSLNSHGIGKVLVVNGHGGNTESLKRVSRRLRASQRMFLGIYDWWVAAPRLLPKLFKPEERHHAGGEETSVNLAVHPHLVLKDEIVDERIRGIAPFGSGFEYGQETLDSTKSGVYGRASVASGKKGDVVVKAVLEELVRVIGWLSRTPLKKFLSAPHK